MDVAGDELTQQDEEGDFAETEIDEETLSRDDDGMFLTEEEDESEGGGEGETDRVGVIGSITARGHAECILTRVLIA